MRQWEKTLHVAASQQIRSYLRKCTATNLVGHISATVCVTKLKWPERPQHWEGFLQWRVCWVMVGGGFALLQPTWNVYFLSPLSNKEDLYFKILNLIIILLLLYHFKPRGVVKPKSSDSLNFSSVLPLEHKWSQSYQLACRPQLTSDH